jgi:hypothetical protein
MVAYNLWTGITFKKITNCTSNVDITWVAACILTPSLCSSVKGNYSCHLLKTINWYVAEKKNWDQKEVTKRKAANKRDIIMLHIFIGTVRNITLAVWLPNCKAIHLLLIYNPNFYSKSLLHCYILLHCYSLHFYSKMILHCSVLIHLQLAETIARMNPLDHNIKLLDLHLPHKHCEDTAAWNYGHWWVTVVPNYINHKNNHSTIYSF